MKTDIRFPLLFATNASNIRESPATIYNIHENMLICRHVGLPRPPPPGGGSNCSLLPGGTDAQSGSPRRPVDGTALQAPAQHALQGQAGARSSGAGLPQGQLPLPVARLRQARHRQGQGSRQRSSGSQSTQTPHGTGGKHQHRRHGTRSRLLSHHGSTTEGHRVQAEGYQNQKDGHRPLAIQRHHRRGASIARGRGMD